MSNWQTHSLHLVMANVLLCVVCGDVHTHTYTLSLCVFVVQPTPESTRKPSSLHKKVQERQTKAEQRQSLLSSLTAHDAPVKTLSQLREECGHSLYHKAVLAMLEAAFTPASQAKKTALLKVDTHATLTVALFLSHVSIFI